MNAEIETFCEKHIVPREARYNLALAVEGILEMLRPGLRNAPLDLSVTYSEKTDALEVALERSGEWSDPLESDQPDDFGLRIIRRVADSVDYQVVDGRGRLAVRIAKK